MLSFDITDRNIRIIKGIENKNKISISSAATLNVDEDIIVNGHVKDVPRLATLMNQKIKQNKMSDKEAIVSISSNLTIFKELSVRRMAKEQDFTKAVKAEMQARVGIDDTYAISYSIVEGSSNDADMVTVLATACPAEVIDSYKRVFSMLGISLRSVIIGCNCITKFLLSDDKNRSKMPLLAVQIDNNFISLNIYENSQLSFSRFASIDPADYDNSADYVYEAVNENIFRMLQFHKSKGTGESIRNVILYGDTKEYVRISRDLEQMDINTSVITVPKNVKGYQNLEVPLYANAIGAMFSRNKATEKINLLEFGGATQAISDRVKSDNSFTVIFAALFLASIIIMGGITLGFWAKDKKIQNHIEDMNAFLKDPATAAQLAKRESRLELQEQVNEYQTMAQLANDAMRSQPYIESAVYNKVEEIIKETIEQNGNKDVVFNLEKKESTFDIKTFDYKEGTVTFEFLAPAGDDPAPKLPALLVENLEKSDYFYDVQYNGYAVEENATAMLYDTSSSSGGAVLVGDTEVRCVGASITMQVKSPVKDYTDYKSCGSVETEGTEE